MLGGSTSVLVLEVGYYSCCLHSLFVLFNVCESEHIDLGQQKLNCIRAASHPNTLGKILGAHKIFCTVTMPKFYVADIYRQHSLGLVYIDLIIWIEA